MGTVASLVVRAPSVPDGLLDEVFAELHDADRRFSPWKPESEVSRLGRGELTRDAASADLREVLRVCEELRVASDGVFDAARWRTDGMIDPTGVVKGWAAERAALVLRAEGVTDFCLNVGGDVIAAGEPFPGRGWLVGIRDPRDPRRVAFLLEIRDASVATSGAYGRERHIVDARTGKTTDAVASVTVVGPRMTLADGYATIAAALGGEGLAWVGGRPGYLAGAIAPDGRLAAHRPFAALLRRPVARPPGGPEEAGAVPGTGQASGSGPDEAAR